MNLVEAALALEYAFHYDTPVILWGSPGIGKSDLVKQLGEKFVVEVIDFRISQMEPIDLRGIPSKEDGKTVYNPPEELPSDPKSKGILFLDEITQGSQSTKAAAYQLILDRRIGKYRLPKGWRIVAASNLFSDGAIIQKLGTALTSRFTHLPVETDVESFSLWAELNNIDPRIIMFLNYAPEYLHKMDPAKPDHPFPNPRMWSTVNKYLGVKSRDIRQKLISGAIGQGTAVTFAGYLQIYEELPSIKEIVKNPLGVPFNEARIDVISAVTMFVVTQVDVSNLKPIMKFLTRVPKEYQTLAVQMINRTKNHLMAKPEMTSWVLENPEIFR